MRKKVLLIDVDDTICQATFLDEINKFLGSNYKTCDLKEYDMSKLIKDDSKRAKFFYDLQKVDIYKDATIFEDAVDVIQKLSEKYNTFICSSCVFLQNEETSGISFKYKFDFLLKHFPFLDPNKFIFVGDKSVINADIMIDDKLENMMHIKNKILFTAYHNTDITDKNLKKVGAVRANSWKDVEKLLLN